MTDEFIHNETTSIQHQLYKQYSSSQSYFYATKISNIVRSRRTPTTLMYDDLECLWEEQDFLKRVYLSEQYPRKMAAFKEYYYYHQDCPRIFSKGIEHLYERWHEKRRDEVYKKLKQMFNQSYSSSDSSEDAPDKHLPPISHFLFDLSEYNPYSKKYYLRVQARKEKEQEQRKKRMAQKTKSYISGLGHDISQMLKNVNDISKLSIMGHNTPRNSKKYSQSVLSQTKSQSKITFKKRKVGQLNMEKSNSSLKQSEEKTASNRHTKQLSDVERKQPAIVTQLKNTSKEALMGQSKILVGDKFRSRSIISLSSFNKVSLMNKNSQQKKQSVNVPKLSLKPQNLQVIQKKNKNVISISNGDRRKGNTNSKSVSKGKQKGGSQNRQFSLKKLATPNYIRQYDSEQFTDRRLSQAKALISYKSEHAGMESTISSRRLGNSNPLKIKLFHKQ